MIMTDDIVSDEEDLISRTWNKLERNLKKEGFREGALKGKEEYYQNGFDIGYEEGFKLGEAFGYHTGFLSALKELNTEKLNALKLKKQLDENHIMESACVLCKDKNFSSNLTNILTLQKERNAEIMNNFKDSTDNG